MFVAGYEKSKMDDGGRRTAGNRLLAASTSPEKVDLD